MPGNNFWSKDIRELMPLPPRKLAPPELAVLCRKLALMLDAGVPVETSLQIVSETESGPARAARLSRVCLAETRVRVARGDGFASALEGTGGFPSLMCGLCAVGEVSAQLPQVMGKLADYYDGQARARGELAAALIYPAAVALMMLAVIVLSVVWVLPGYAQVFAASGVEMPLLTRVLMAVADALARYYLGIVTGFAVLALSAVLYACSVRGRELRVKLGLRLPAYRQQINLRLVQALHILLASGQTLAEALPVCAETFNPVVRRDLSALLAELSGGRSFWRLLAEIPYMDPLLVSLARVGEETGRLPQALEKCARYFEQAQRQTVQKLNKLVEPAITVILGLLLGLVMLAVILPTFSLTGVF